MRVIPARGVDYCYLTSKAQKNKPKNPKKCENFKFLAQPCEIFLRYLKISQKKRPRGLSKPLGAHFAFTQGKRPIFSVDRACVILNSANNPTVTTAIDVQSVILKKIEAI